MDEALLDLYTDYLISSFSYTTATGLAQLLDQSMSHDQITRFLAQRPRTSADLWHVVKPVVRRVERDEGVLIVDDSIEERPYTAENDLISWHYDHSKDRLLKGINFLTALYQVGAVSLPVAVDLVTKTEVVIDKQTNKPRRKSTLTKNEPYREMLKACAHNQIKFRFVFNDAWYSSSDNMLCVRHERDKQFIMPLKSNRKVALTLADKQQGVYVAVESLALGEGAVRELYLEAVDFPLLFTKQVFTNDDRTTGTLYLVASDLTLTYDEVTTIYQRRWSVEEYHKSLKHNASLAQVADAHDKDPDQPLLCSAMCVCEVGTTESQDQAEPLCIEVKDLCFGSSEVSGILCKRLAGLMERQTTTHNTISLAAMF